MEQEMERERECVLINSALNKQANNNKKLFIKQKQQIKITCFRFRAH